MSISWAICYGGKMEVTRRTKEKIAKIGLKSISELVSDLDPYSYELVRIATSIKLNSY